MANRGCVVLLGDFSNERLDLSSIGRDFCWSVSQTLNLSGLEEIGRARIVLAVLVQADAAGALGMAWPNALSAVRAAAPQARIIVCHKVHQTHARTEMVDAGAFGVLLSPLSHSEVRQSLGFVWASKITPLKSVSSADRKTRTVEAPAQGAA